MSTRLEELRASIISRYFVVDPAQTVDALIAEARQEGAEMERKRLLMTFSAKPIIVDKGSKP